MRRKPRPLLGVSRLPQRNVRPLDAAPMMRPLLTFRGPIYAGNVVAGTNAVGATLEIKFDYRPGNHLGDIRQLGGQEADAKIRQALPQAHGTRRADHRELHATTGSHGCDTGGCRRSTRLGLRGLPVRHRQGVQGGMMHLVRPMEAGQRADVGVRGGCDWADLPPRFAPDRYGRRNTQFLLASLDAAQVGPGALDASR